MWCFGVENVKQTTYCEADDVLWSRRYTVWRLTQMYAENPRLNVAITIHYSYSLAFRDKSTVLVCPPLNLRVGYAAVRNFPLFGHLPRMLRRYIGLQMNTRAANQNALITHGKRRSFVKIMEGTVNPHLSTATVFDGVAPSLTYSLRSLQQCTVLGRRSTAAVADN
jgi:hypothetical protein